MALYKYLKDGNGVDRTDMILRTSDRVRIPSDPNNKDWRDYLDWLSVPNTPDPSDPESQEGVINRAKKTAAKAVFNNKNLNTKDRLDAVIEYLELDK